MQVDKGGRSKPPYKDIPSRESITRLVCDVLTKLRANKPRIHAVTSAVAGPITANGLLALGATPSLSIDREEITDFIKSADGVLLNMGMLDAERRVSLPLAAQAAQAHGKPCVLDPVFADRSASRRALAEDLLATQPAIIKLNKAEASTFAPAFPASSTRIITGERDEIAQAERCITLTNGTPLLSQVTATGCLLGAILAACHAVEGDSFAASMAGISILNIAAEVAAQKAQGPGSFASHLLDALANLTHPQIEKLIKGDFTHAS